MSNGPGYGYQILKELEQRSRGYFIFKEGTLYPVLHRLEKDGFIRGEWQAQSGGRQRRYYFITEKGRAAVAEHRNQWLDFMRAMSLITGSETI